MREGYHRLCCRPLYIYARKSGLPGQLWTQKQSTSAGVNWVLETTTLAAVARAPKTRYDDAMSTSSAFWVRPGNTLESLDGATSIDAPVGLEVGALVWRAGQGAPWVTLAGPRASTHPLWRLLLAEGHIPRASDAATTLARHRVDNPLVGHDGRVDLTHRPFFTLDSARSKAPEHAIDLTLEQDGYRMRLAIVDASAFVSESDCLWQEALNKGARHHVPGLTLALLPSMLADEALALHPGKKRLVMVVELLLDLQGHPLDVSVYRAEIINQAQVSFASAQAYFGQVSDHPLSGQPYAQALTLVKSLGALRLAIDERGDWLMTRKHDVDVQLRGLAFVRVDLVQSVAELWMRALRAIADKEAERWLEDTVGGSDAFAKDYSLKAPSEPLLEHFEQVVSELIVRRSLSRDRWQWRPGRESLATYLRGLPKDRACSRVVAAIERQALLTQPGRSMSSEVGFTTPLGGVAGLFGHLALAEHERDFSSDSADALRALSLTVAAAAARADVRQERLDKATNAMVLERWFQHDLKLAERRPWRRGTLVHAKATKLYILLDQGRFEVKVYLATLANRSASPRLSAKGALVTIGDDLFMLGDSVVIRVHGREAHGWVFELRPDSESSRVEADN